MKGHNNNLICCFHYLQQFETFLWGGVLTVKQVVIDEVGTDL